MSNAHAISLNHSRFDQLQDRLPKLGLLVAIIIAWALTLAWPPPPANLQPRLPSDLLGSSQYPVRIALPAAAPLQVEKLDALIRDHEAGGSPQLTPAQMTEQSNERSEPGQAGEALQDRAEQLANVDLAPGEVLAINYDLTSLKAAPEKLDRTDGSLTVEKQLFVDGVSTGEATIRIESGAQILISTTSVAKALGDKTEALPRRISGALAKSTGFIPFYELRSAGIDVRYDPITDRVSLSTAS